jgi:glycosyltransferase involved in cell wall biosynthesis
MTSTLAERFELRRVSTHRDAGRAGKAFQAASGLVRVAWQLVVGGIDVVYVHTSSGSSLRRKVLVAGLARLARRPYVVHVHSGEFDNAYHAAAGWERWCIRRMLGGAASVVVLSPTWERRLMAIVACRTSSIPNPVAIPHERAPLAANPPLIVSLGRLGEQKGSTVLVRALATLDGSLAGARLVLAGDGDRGPVRSEAASLGVGDRVGTPGWIGPSDRATTLLAASVFALPAREEGLPVALLEAMAYGLPCVVTPVGGIPDVFEDGAHGLFVPADDPGALAEALRHVLGDRKLARKMGARARRTAEELFATEVVAARVADVLDAALTGSTTPDPAKSRQETGSS